MSQSSGTVTGFASVIVDGTEFHDDEVTPVAEREPGVIRPAEAKLGQFVELEFERLNGEFRARSIRLDAAVVGYVSAVSAAEGVLEVMGQTVFENDNADGGPVTLYAGVTGLDGLSAGDAVEVHGMPRYNSLTRRYDVQATRIEKLSSAPTALRVAGVVTSLRDTESPGRFQLGGLVVDRSAAVLLPQGREPTAGARVVVWASEAPRDGVLTATGVRTVERMVGATELPARLGGSVSAHDVQAKRFDLAGVTVSYAAAEIVPPQRPLTDGAYVQAEGVYDTQGVLQASRVRISRSADADFREVRLKGRISRFAGLTSFLVRGTEVDASGISDFEGCGARPLVNDRRVEIEGRVLSGRRPGSVVWATRLKCED
ncbi:DUF5666 domain-containing protein [Aquabacterium sp. A7-Y]|uniref:DUF5666 domain-containing protein n=1 Tax=Aquabacterium sp. A7-Y TaxID=1349605 RepID=UPI00223D0845|nr:DUF5666 domain-containing protein [Aquabacterium sp. A7-Y]MCW7537745.1 DUF5666 domain-containing protein [Aquabacterium sp. A7-Y]